MPDGAVFGVPPLDRLLGPVPKGNSVLLHHDPSVEALPFLYQAAAYHLGAGTPVVFVSAYRPPARVRASIEDLSPKGVSLDGLACIDAYSPLMGAREPTAYRLEEPQELIRLAELLERAAVDHPGAVLLVDSLSAFLERTDARRFVNGFDTFLRATNRFLLTGLLWTAWTFSPDVEDALHRVPAVVALRGVEERVVLHQSIAVQRSAWTALSRGTVLYKVAPPGGIFSYIPKILVTGPHSSGKSTFVRSVTESSVSVERGGTTVALDRGTATVDGVKAEVFGTPGLERFDPLLPTLAGQAVAVVVVADATDPATFGRAKEMLQKIWVRGLYVVIALNKADLPKAVSVEEAVRRLAPPKGVDVLPCDARDPASARRVLLHLIAKVLGGVAG